MLRAPSRSPLVQLIARLLIVALVAAAIPTDAIASLPVGEASKLTKSAFGELLAHTGSDPQPYAFTGEPYDPNVGFQYHRARWMDATTGRFVSADPFEGIELDPLSLQDYIYAGCNPTNKSDATGLMTLSEQMPTLGIITILAALSLVTYCVAQHAVSTTLDQAGIDTSTARGPCVNRTGTNRMRVQLQQGLYDHIHAKMATANERLGVSARQLEAALTALFVEGKPLIPSRYETDFLRSVVYAGRWGRARVPTGVYGPQRTVHQEYFPDPRIGPYRVDVENLRGHNLRVY